MSDEFIRCSEAWTDNNGNVLVKNNDGDYTLFIDPRSMYFQQGGIFGGGRQIVLNDTDYVRERSVRIRTKFLNFLRSKR